MKIDDNSIKELIETLKIDKRGQKFQGFNVFRIEGSIQIDIYLSYEDGYKNIKEIPRKIAKEKLDKMMSDFGQIRSDNKELDIILSNFSVEYGLIFDYGNGGVAVCVFKNGSYNYYN
jgi:hypothetical protein